MSSIRWREDKPKSGRQIDYWPKVFLHDSPCILGFMCSYYRQQIIVHQKVTYCWVTERKKRHMHTGKLLCDRGLAIPSRGGDDFELGSGFSAAALLRLSVTLVAMTFKRAVWIGVEQKRLKSAKMKDEDFICQKKVCGSISRTVVQLTVSIVSKSVWNEMSVFLWFSQTPHIITPKTC